MKQRSKQDSGTVPETKNGTEAFTKDTCRWEICVVKKNF